MRSTVIDYHQVIFKYGFIKFIYNKGKMDICSMDEELTLIIFISKFCLIISCEQ